MKHTFFFVLFLVTIVNLSTECSCNEPYLDIVQNLSGLKICEENLDQYSWQSLFQKGKFYRSIDLLNAKVQEDYLQTVLKIVRKFTGYKDIGSKSSCFRHKFDPRLERRIPNINRHFSEPI